MKFMGSFACAGLLDMWSASAKNLTQLTLIENKCPSSTRIRRINGGQREISSTVIIDVLAQLKCLKHLNYTGIGSMFVPDQPLEGLPNQTLTSLYLNTKYVDEEAFPFYPLNCPELTELYLWPYHSNCSDLSDFFLWKGFIRKTSITIDMSRTYFKHFNFRVEIFEDVLLQIKAGSCQEKIFTLTKEKWITTSKRKYTISTLHLQIDLSWVKSPFHTNGVIIRKYPLYLE
ncbi:unnamed protein product [Rhizopus stolonifer]